MANLREDLHRAVGLLLVVKINKPRLGYRVVLRKRGPWNWETDKPESWRGSYQLTCHGRCKNGEQFTNALAREIKEELGFTVNEISSILKNSKEISPTKTKESFIKTFFCLVPHDLISSSPAQDSLVPFTRRQILKFKGMREPLSDGTIPEKTTIFSDSDLRMWPDERQVVLNIFQILKNVLNNR